MLGNKIMRKIVLFIGLAIYLGNASAALKTIQPHTGAIQQSFTELARTQLENTYDLNMPTAGKLQHITLQVGDSIKQGQVIAQLVQKPLAQAVNEELGLRQTFKEWYALQLKTLQRRESLGKKGFIEQESIDQTRTYKNMLIALIYRSNAAIRVAKYNLRESTIRAPVSGIILKRYTQGGTWLTAGTQLLQIGNLHDLEVICDVLTQDAQLLKIGDPVLLSSIGSPTILHGKVKRIEPAGFTKKSSLGVDEQRVNVIISIAHPETANLGVGYRLQAQFLVGSKQAKALIIPRFSVLQDNQGQYYVFVVKGKKRYKQTIKIGIKTDTKISVLSGITGQDQIVAQPTADM